MIEKRRIHERQLTVEFKSGIEVKIGYFSQHLTILNDKKSIIENVQSTSSQNETLIRTVLARMHFWDEDVYQKVGILSGGE